jgi:hypothetical protein
LTAKVVPSAGSSTSRPVTRSVHEAFLPLIHR